MNRFAMTIATTALFMGTPGNIGVAAHEIMSNQATAASYIDTYNAGDIAEMRKLMHPEIQWISVEGSAFEVAADGREALVEQMTAYFASPSVPRSTYEQIIENGRFLTMRETAHWTDSAGKQQAQSSIAVYEFERGLVRRVWYFPAQK